MILIVTHRSDFTADFLINRLNDKRVSYYRFNCEDLETIPYSFGQPHDLLFSLSGFNKFSSVWYRRTKLPMLQGIQQEEERRYLLAEYDALLQNIVYSLSVPVWLSHPHSIHAAENKVAQLQMARSAGFEIPETLITNQRDEIRAFSANHFHNIIIKPLRSGRLQMSNTAKLFYTTRLKEFDIEQLDAYDITPCIFQKYIDKVYEIRVTVVGSQVFAARVDSQSHAMTLSDWRREKLPFVAYELPEKVASICVDVVKRFNLTFSAIDLIKTPDGRYIFLELNPNGQWAWVEKDTGLPISEHIINYLMQANV